MKLSSLNLLLLAAAGASAQANNVTLDNAPFADDLTAALYITSPTVENECTSSLGVSMALSLVYPAAISDSEEQMRTVLGYPQDSQSFLLWENTSLSLTDRYQGRCYQYNSFAEQCQGEEPNLEIANAVFVDQNITLNATYQAVVGDLVQQLDFASEDSGSMVNQWVNESTNGVIESIVEDGPLEPWIMVAINSIYLKASWDEQFNEQHTNQDLFYLSSDEIAETATEAHFMHQVEYFRYSHQAVPGFQVLELPFAGDRESNGLSMIFVLPLTDTTGMATSVDVLGALPDLERTRMAVSLPKFIFESKYEDNLKEALQSLNMTAPFEERPDNLCIADSGCNAFIDVIIQKTFIDVNEKGVEAAAVTAVGIALTSAIVPPPGGPMLFQANRPFQFFLYERMEDMVLFEGQVGAPGISDDSVANLDKKHADEDFWRSTFGVDVVQLPPNVVTSAETTFEVDIERANYPPEDNPGTELNEEAQPMPQPVSSTVDATKAETEPDATADAATTSSAFARSVSLVAGFLLVVLSAV